MTGRYLEGLIMARQMGITSPELSKAEERLGKYLLSLQGPDGLIHNLVTTTSTTSSRRAAPSTAYSPGTRPPATRQPARRSNASSAAC